MTEPRPAGGTEADAVRASARPAAVRTSWDPLLDRSGIATGLAEDLTFRGVNEAMCTLLGRPRDQIVGRHLLSFLVDADAEAARVIAELESGVPRSTFRASLVRGDAQLCWAAIDVVVVQPDDGPLQVLVQAVDVTDLQQARVASELSGRRFAKLLTNARDIVSLLDREGAVRFTTATDVGALGFPAGSWVGTKPIELIHPDDAARAAATWRAVIDTPGEAIDVEVRMPFADGGWADIVFTGVNLLHDPDIAGVVLTARNVTHVRQTERLASGQAAVLELIARGEPVEGILDRCLALLEAHGSGGTSAIWLVDGDETRIATRPGAELAPPALVPRSLLPVESGGAAVVGDVATAALSDGLRATLADQGIAAYWAHPIRTLATDRQAGVLCTMFAQPHEAEPEELRAGELVCSLVAIALERIDSEDRLAHQALHDGLTGLPNRTLLLDRLEHALARRERAGGEVAVLFCDLDRFKVVNDSLGHGVGDQLLIAAAERLQALLNPDDTVARFGGDEFVILLEDQAGPEQAVRVADLVAAALARPFELPDGQEVFLTTSIGIALASDHRSADGWLRDADAAMYRAKEQGRNQTVVFDTAMRDAAIARLQVEHDLHRGVRRGELVVHYQPVIDLTSGRISGAEALVRWRHPTRGLLPPGDFIPVAEETGSIEEVSHFVLDVATRDMATLIGEHPIDGFQLGVNVSARQIVTRGLGHWVQELCDRNGWPLQHLLLEITETALAYEWGDPAGELAAVTDLGVQFAIDDFGTGHSSLTRLGRLPIDQVKVDQSFVAGIDLEARLAHRAPRTSRIVDAVIALAGALELRTCAEGVETDAQLDYLRRVGCDFAQGFLFSRPLPLEQFAALIAADPRW